MRPQAEIEKARAVAIVASPLQNARPLVRGPYINSTAEKRPYIEHKSVHSATPRRRSALLAIALLQTRPPDGAAFAGQLEGH
jgi:hypothetical protein